MHFQSQWLDDYSVKFIYVVILLFNDFIFKGWSLFTRLKSSNYWKYYKMVETMCWEETTPSLWVMFLLLYVRGFLFYKKKEKYFIYKNFNTLLK